MEDLFLKYEFDLMKITWEHGVNSKDRIIEILKSDVDCIETDIVYCFDDGLTYNSHPPVYKSDLTFDEFWNMVKSSNKIVKLDFKMIEAVEPCLRHIEKNQFSRLILNADVLSTTNSNVKPLDWNEFIGLCIKYMPRAVISIGWTTVRESQIGYTWADVYDMNMVIKEIMLHEANSIVTLPVDIHMLSLNSIPKLSWLLDQYSGHNLSWTIWTYKDVCINLNCLTAVRKLLKTSSVFLDLPQLSTSDRDKILATEPYSDLFKLEMNVKTSGKNVWKSKSSYVIGSESCVEIQREILKRTEFFIVFDSICSDIEDRSECIIFPKVDPSNSLRIVLRKVGIASYSCGNEDFIANSNANVYYVSLEPGTECVLSIAPVEDYDTSIVKCDFRFGLSLTIESEITLVVKTSSRGSRFVCVDFVNESLSLQIDKS